MDDTKDTQQVVVIGAGVAGLTAATVAARAGATVTLVEPHPDGGRARSDDVEGFRFNLGPHALYEGGPATRVLAALGIDLPGAYPGPRGQCVLQGNRVHRAPVSPTTLLASGAIRARDKVRLGTALARAQRMDPASVAGVSVAEWFDGMGLAGPARALGEALVRLTTYGTAPELLSAEAAVTQIQLGTVRYLHGGWQAMVDALAAAATDAGVARVRARLEALERVADGWRLRLTGGTDPSSVPSSVPSVVLAVGSPGATARLAGLDDAWAATAGPAMELSCLDLGVRRPVRPWFLLGVDEPLYLAQHAPPAALAPEGMATVSLARYLSPGERPDADEVRAQLFAHAARVGIGPEDVVVQRYLHKMVAVHGIPLASRGGFAGRPGVEVPDRPGLFLVGDWVGGEGLLVDASFASAERAGGAAAAWARGASAAASRAGGVAAR